MILFEHVNKVYTNGYTANKNISFQVEKGKMVGIVGANGAGKSTLIRQLLKILDVTEGSIKVDEKTEYLDLLSYVPQFSAIYPALTVKESLILIYRYQGIKKRTAIAKTEQIIKELEISEIAEKHCFMLSGGERKILAFATAIAQDKPYLILDEITSMVDVLSKEKIWRMLKQLKKEKGILLASHDMEEIRNLCDEIVILRHGEIVFKGSVDKVGEGKCTALLKAVDMEETVNILDQNGNLYEKEDELLKISFENIEEANKTAHFVSEKTTITKWNCVFPDFYEGVMEIVEGDE